MIKLRAEVAVLLIVIIVGAAFVPAFGSHVHAGEPLVPASWRAENPGPYLVDITVALDEEWIDIFGSNAEQQAARVVEIAAANLRPAGLYLRLADFTRWTSANEAETIHPLLEAVEDAIPIDGRGLVVALTAGSYGAGVDGLARARRPHVVVRHHAGNLDRDAYVLTHEIGHIFGLDHHVREDGLCFMADHGYDPDEHWCPEHLELLRNNAGYLDYANDADPQE